MRIHVDRNKCTGIGLCEALCPDIFEVDDDGVLQLVSGEVIPDDVDADVDSAITSCPTAALSKQP
jgi:ferredoxin